jgi:peptidylprolyl isomerase
MNNPGDHVRFLYRGSLANGEEFDLCLEEPHEIVLGRHQIFWPLEQALMEMSLGEERTIEVPTEDAYGVYQEEAIQKVDLSLIPNGQNMLEGELILWENPRTAQPIPAKVLKIDDPVVTLDFNHPLVDQNLVYWVKLVGISSDSRA